MDHTIRQLADTFPVLTSNMNVVPLPFGEGFYQGLSERFGNFEQHVLVSCHRFDEGWQTWERHPHGDEIVCLMTGEITLALLVNGETRSLKATQAGEYVVVPKGVWHTAVDAKAATVLFITPGQGTENRTDPDDPATAC
ncbi:MAG: hypothetical protein AAGA91_15800 [Pseudomonadota bacterium]